MKIDEIVDSSRILDEIVASSQWLDEMKTLDILIVDNVSSFCTFWKKFHFLSCNDLAGNKKQVLFRIRSLSKVAKIGSVTT